MSPCPWPVDYADCAPAAYSALPIEDREKWEQAATDLALDLGARSASARKTGRPRLWYTYGSTFGICRSLQMTGQTALPTASGTWSINQGSSSPIVGLRRA